MVLLDTSLLSPAVLSLALSAAFAEAVAGIVSPNQALCAQSWSGHSILSSLAPAFNAHRPCHCPHAPEQILFSSPEAARYNVDRYGMFEHAQASHNCIWLAFGLMGADGRGGSCIKGSAWPKTRKSLCNVVLVPYALRPIRSELGIEFQYKVICSCANS